MQSTPWAILDELICGGSEIDSEGRFTKMTRACRDFVVRTVAYTPRLPFLSRILR